MAVTVTDDFTTISNADATTGWSTLNADIIEVIATRGNSAQGTNALGGLVVGTGVGGHSYDSGAANVDLTDEHILFWLFPAGFEFDTEANGGLRIRVSTNSLATAAYGEWYVGGEDTAIAYKLGTWRCYAADAVKPFDATNGTPPAITANRSFAGVCDIIAVEPEASQWFTDEVKRGTGITITGGAATPRGSAEIASNDDTNGRGTFRDVAGAYYVMGRITIGDVTAATNSTYEDTNETWVWQDLPVSSTFHVLEFVGGTGTNRATFGTSSGTGTAKEGSSGNSFLAGGSIPFRVRATDSDITAEMFGCNLVNASALYDDAIRNFKREDYLASSYVDDTRDANDAGATDCEFFPAGSAVNDAAYFGHDERISLLKINTGTAGAGTYTVTWEYYNGTAWISLIDVTDGTNNFKTTGLQTVSYAIPDNWSKVTVDTDNRYWIRARRDGGTMTTSPVMTQCFASMGGMVEWEHTNAEAIRCNFTNMDLIRIRSSAKLKKCNIVDSVAPATSAALSFGPTDPAADTVRDIVINGGINGLLLQPTGTTTYNLRNIKFSGQSGKKVRIEATSGTSVTINTLDGGDGLLTTDLDLAGGITTGDITIVNSPVTVKVTAKKRDGTAVQNAKVMLAAASSSPEGPFPVEETVTITRGSPENIATVSHTGHGMSNNDKVLIFGANEIGYDGVKTITVVDANSYTYAITASPLPATPATGTITSTFVALYGLTDANGEISTSRAYPSDQSVSGWARKYTESPDVFFQEGVLVGTVSNSTGIDTTAVLVSDI